MTHGRLGQVTPAALAVAAAVSMAAPGAAAADSCRLLQFGFEPDCLVRDATSGRCRFEVTRPDFGPQLAVWVESADGATFVDTVLVTNAVALYGIGNRPGRWDFRSGPRFPYGRRPMALPVWAHRRGVQYRALSMNDGYDDAIADHAAVSSPEPHFCRPMMPSEIVDAVTCASGSFRSAKGLFDDTMPQSFYPPRADLLNWDDLCVPLVSADGTACDYGDARMFGLINDIDTIAAATPPYDQPFTGTWRVPQGLAPGGYALMLEVSKEFDSDVSYAHSSYLSTYETTYYDGYGLVGNVGQPSVVYRVPFSLTAPVPATAVATASGYGDWTGATGALSPLDATITDAPGSGAGRLRASDGPGGAGRVHLVELPCAAVDCTQSGPPPQPPVDSSPRVQDAVTTTFSFRQVADAGGGKVIAYELRYTPVASSFLQSVDESTFLHWTPAPAPAVDVPGTVTTVTMPVLAPSTAYAIGLRALGTCGWSAPTFGRIATSPAIYKKLSGCVIATAAYGSALHPDVALLRRERDWAAARSSAVRLAALLYGDTAPPLAALIGRSETARQLTRAVLRPFMLLNRAAYAGVQARRAPQ